MNWQERAKKLASDHWNYHDILIPVFLSNDPKKFMEAKHLWGDWYKAIAIHFYKHAIEDVQDGVIEINRRQDISPSKEETI